MDPATPYAPHEKGKIERLHRTIAETLIAPLPGCTDGPRDVRGRLEYTGDLLMLAQLVEAFATWVLGVSPRSERCGRSSLYARQRFTADPTPLRLVAPEDARALLTARRSGMVRRDGVHHGGPAYIAVELTELVGETIEIAFAPHDQRSIEVYWRGASLCTAAPHSTLSAPQQAQIISPTSRTSADTTAVRAARFARTLARAQRADVLDLRHQAHAWMTRRLDEHPHAVYQERADAVFLLARHGDSSSEIYTRIRAALDAFTRAGEEHRRRRRRLGLALELGEIRPGEFNAACARAAALADQTPDPSTPRSSRSPPSSAAPATSARWTTTPSPLTAADSTEPGAASSRSRPSYDASSPPNTNTSARTPATAGSRGSPATRTAA